MDAFPGTELFESYAADFKDLLQTVSHKLSTECAGTAKTTAESRKQALRRVEMELEEADEMLAQMELEVNGVSDRQTKAQLQGRLRTNKADLQRKRTEAKKLAADLDRSDLLGSAERYADDDDSAETGLPSAKTQAQRARMLNTTDKLQDSSRRLDESHRLALETEDLGTGILGNLRGQREQIENTRNRLVDADRGIDKASGTLGKMIRRAYQQRVVTGAIITVLVLLILLVLWLKIR